jgi:hypothetical protein
MPAGQPMARAQKNSTGQRGRVSFPSKTPDPFVHRDETLPGREARQAICRAPAGHDVDGNLQVRNCIRKTGRAFGNCALEVRFHVCRPYGEQARRLHGEVDSPPDFAPIQFQHYLDRGPHFDVELVFFGLGEGALEYVRG